MEYKGNDRTIDDTKFLHITDKDQSKGILICLKLFISNTVNSEIFFKGPIFCAVYQFSANLCIIMFLLLISVHDVISW